jgi:predicted PurR-regulated permease PerM
MDERKVVIEFSFKTIFWILSALLVIWLTITLKDILVSVLLSFILATAISPLVDFLEKRKVPRSISVGGVILTTIGLIYLVIRLVFPPFMREISNLIGNRDAYVATINGYLQHLSPALRDGVTNVLDNIFNSLKGIDLGGIITSATGFFSGLLEAILVFVLSFYILLNNKGVEGAVIAYVPKQHQKRVLSIYRKISNKMTSWLRGQVILGLMIFAIDLIGLSVLRVNYALTLAIVAGLMELLPYIGPFVSGSLAILIALTQSPVLALIVFVFYVLVSQLDGHILAPQVMKKSLGLNPIAVILAVIIGGKLLGFIGILIAVPMAAAIGVLLEEFVKKQELEAN